MVKNNSVIGFPLLSIYPPILTSLSNVNEKLCELFFTETLCTWFGVSAEYSNFLSIAKGLFSNPTLPTLHCSLFFIILCNLT